MREVNIWDIEGTKLPAGRRTKAIPSQNGAMKSNKFCQGYMVMCRGGDIPGHGHETVGSYMVIKGHGETKMNEGKQPVKEGNCIFIPGNSEHALYSTGEEELHMMFVYAPGIIVDHWAKGQNEEVK